MVTSVKQKAFNAFSALAVAVTGLALSTNLLNSGLQTPNSCYTEDLEEPIGT